jgi:hypothetical protein
MDLAPLLLALDAVRAHGAFEKLCRHHIGPLVLTGGIAIELHKPHPLSPWLLLSLDLKRESHRRNIY